MKTTLGQKYMSPHHPNQIKNDLETWVMVTKLLSFSIMIPCCIHANFVEIHKVVEEIRIHKQFKFMSNNDQEKLDSSQKVNHLFTMSQCYLMQMVNPYPTTIVLS